MSVSDRNISVWSGNSSLRSGNDSLWSSNDSFVSGRNPSLNVSGMMKDNGINSLCQDTNSSFCNKDGLGIRLSTPVLTMSCGVLGNIIALIVLYTSRTEMKKTVFYTFLCGLALTDLMGQLMTGPIAIIVYANNLQWVGGEPVCFYHACVMICFGMITPLLVCCMSIERVIGLRCPYFHERVVTKSKARLAMLGCWLFVILFCCMPFVGFGSYEHQFPGTWCFLNYHKESPSDVGYAYTYAFINIITISMIIVANSTVTFTLIQMKRTRRTNNSPAECRRNKTKTKIKLEKETLMAWFLCANTLLFTVCCFPLNFNILINQITGNINYPADLIALRMAIINQILDPWLYILLRKSVITKAASFIKYRICKRRQTSPQRSAKYVTNYSVGSMKMINAVVQDARIAGGVVNHVDFNHVESVSDTSDSSGIDSEYEILQEISNQNRKSIRNAVSMAEFNVQSYNSVDAHSCEIFQSSANKTMTRRQISLPARLARES